MQLKTRLIQNFKKLKIYSWTEISLKETVVML